MTTLSSLAGTPDLGEQRGRSAGSWVAFCVLALYGTLRWGTMLPAQDQQRLLIALGLALANAIALRQLPRRGTVDWLIPVLLVLDVVLVLLIAGFPFSWVVGGHWGALGTGLSNGISQVPGVLVPYRGHDANTVAVIALGAGALLLCAGLAFGNVRGTPATAQLLLAALPLLSLAIVPSAIVAPHVSFVHGLLTFVLVALLVFSPRLTAQRVGGGLLLLVTAGVVGAIVAGVVAGTTPWLRVATGRPSGAGGPGLPERFDWSQTYGGLGPASTTTVLTVTAEHPAYWKTEDLDRFTGTRWVMGHSAGNGLVGVSRAHLHQYSQFITVAVEHMISPQVVSAGYAYAPDLLGASTGSDPGVWTVSPPLTDGTRYPVEVYTPRPSTARLAGTGRAYPSALNGLRTLTLPGDAYAPVEALARRLTSGTHTPIAYVDRVLDYLRGRRFSYTLHPPKGGRYPLVSFLIDTRKGYCQQFAGAMALLLRMDRIPARVAVGFSTGTRVPGRRGLYTVTGKDAHAWVEAWFPTYGWVTFDPTPGRATAGAGAGADTPPVAGVGAAGASTPTGQVSPIHAAAPAHAGRLATEAGGGGGLSGSGGGFSVGPILLGIVGLGLLVGLLRIVRAYWRRPSTEELTAELERAFALCGQPIGAEVTLAALGRRLADSPRAAAYIDSLAASRYAAGGGTPTTRGRAALRRWLARGLGPLGLTRALWALPRDGPSGCEPAP